MGNGKSTIRSLKNNSPSDLQQVLLVFASFFSKSSEVKLLKLIEEENSRKQKCKAMFCMWQFPDKNLLNGLQKEIPREKSEVSKDSRFKSSSSEALAFCLSTIPIGMMNTVKDMNEKPKQIIATLARLRVKKSEVLRVKIPDAIIEGNTRKIDTTENFILLIKSVAAS